MPGEHGANPTHLTRPLIPGTRNSAESLWAPETHRPAHLGSAGHMSPVNAHEALARRGTNAPLHRVANARPDVATQPPTGDVEPVSRVANARARHGGQVWPLAVRGSGRSIPKAQPRDASRSLDRQ